MPPATMEYDSFSVASAFAAVVLALDTFPVFTILNRTHQLLYPRMDVAPSVFSNERRKMHDGTCSCFLPFVYI
jgi:hypothetical protein